MHTGSREVLSSVAFCKPQLNTAVLSDPANKKKWEEKRHITAKHAATEGGLICTKRERNTINHVISRLAADTVLKNSEIISIFVCNF